MLDNYDSFTYNLVHLFEELGAEAAEADPERFLGAGRLAGRPAGADGQRRCGRGGV